MSHPLDQHWADLLAALQMEAVELGGFGEITVRIRFSEGQPRDVRTSERLRTYRLGQTAPPLKGSKSGVPGSVPKEG